MVVLNIPEVPKSEHTENYFSEFSNNTTIHGFKYFVDRGISVFEKIWWVLAFCLCAYVCTSMVMSNWVKWDENPVFLSVSTKPMKHWEVPFPAITICPENKIWKTKYNYTYYKEKFKNRTLTLAEKQQFADVKMFCHDNPKQYVTRRYNISIEALKVLIYDFYQIPLLISYCMWRGRIVEMCKFLFSPTLTNEGLCISFNMVNKYNLFTNKTYTFNGHFSHKNVLNWDYDNNYAKVNKIGYPFRTTKITDSLTVQLNLDLNNIDKNCDSSQGYKVYAHHPAEMPSKYVKINNEKKYRFEIKPEAIISDSSLIDYNPQRRKCFYSYERPLKFYKIYTRRNCETECLANFTLKSCGCIPYYMPF
ncbi:pickpocket protein 28-like isoform X2 [Tribolium castaneum]|uniref:pickpocket protein 28-like isoform X2 n=1 Tax=Tribolium castaneum TaxID=7070 RepID=UPI00077DD963|nr:PREDICTED: pickpocket protein 28-like isoform X2 [Tribolium castaneum]|eukprot:XP_015839368.1 PREDICTED: pickpocket protein 28-like isoform X2 [Tribolium castaneum]